MVKYNLMEQVGQKPKGGMAVKQAFFTKKPDALYAITPGWPGKELVLRDVKTAGRRHGSPCSACRGRLSTRSTRTTLTITIPDLAPGQAPCRHAFALKITGAELLPEK